MRSPGRASSRRCCSGVQIVSGSSVQQSLAKSLLMEVAYAANKGTHLQFNNLALNSLTFEQTALGTYTQQLVPNPFYGIITDPKAVNLNRQTAQYYRLLRPMPQFDGTGVGTAEPARGDSNYHALQVYAAKRTGSVVFTVGYTWSKALGGRPPPLLRPWSTIMPTHPAAT